MQPHQTQWRLGVFQTYSRYIGWLLVAVGFWGAVGFVVWLAR